MMLTLSRRLQRQAPRQIAQISFFNAVGFGFNTGQVVYLLALAYGANDTQMGLLYAAPFITTLSALFVPILLSGQETTAIWSRFWWLRTFVCLGYFVIPWLAFGNARIWMVVFCYYLFMGARSFGMSGYFTVFRALAPPRENAALYGRSVIAAQIGVLLAQSVAFLMLTTHLVGSETRTLFALLALGVLFNGIAAARISRLPKTGYLQDGSMRGLLRVSGEIMRTPALREVVLVTTLQATMLVFSGYLISYLRNTAGYSGGEIFMFTVAGVLASMFISNIQRMIGARIRERVLLLASHAALVLISLLWAFVHMAPFSESNRLVVCLLYAATVLCMTVSTTVALQLRTVRLPKHHSVEHSIVYDMAQVIGAVAAIGIARLAVAPNLSATAGLHTYSLLFLFWTLTSTLVCILATRMHSDRNARLKQEFSALLPSSIFTIIRTHRLDRDDNLIRRQLALEGVLQNPSHVSRELILERLHSPDLGTRSSCIRVLMGYPMDEALPLLLAEAASAFSPLREEAITAIGFAGKRDRVPELQRIWETAPARVRAVLIKTLLRLGEPVDPSRLRDTWADCPRLRRMDILIGLAVTRRSEMLLDLMGEELADQPDPYWTRTLFDIAAASAGHRESMFEILEEEAQGKGFEMLSATIETSWPPELSPDSCRQDIDTGDFAGLTCRMRKVLNQPWVIAYDRTTALGSLFLLLLHIGGNFSTESTDP